jgi:hypothetical protein
MGSRRFSTLRVTDKGFGKRRFLSPYLERVRNAAGSKKSAQRHPAAHRRATSQSGTSACFSHTLSNRFEYEFSNLTISVEGFVNAGVFHMRIVAINKLLGIFS